MLYTIAVRELCEFTAKRGDLDLRFTPAPSAEEGVEGHALVAARRGATHQSEVWLSSRYQQLTVRGRADGFDATRGRLEEVKTYKGRLDQQPSVHRQLHWAQAKIYAWLVCERDALEALDVVLVYFDIASRQETAFVERCSAADLRRFFDDHCQRFLAWAVQQVRHREQRDEALLELRFPFADFRQGQRGLARAVYNAARSRRCLLIEAPTGSGKTVGTLFPMLKAMPSQGIDKLFYLTAKSSGRQLAIDALIQLAGPAAKQPLRVLELVALAKVCEFPELACHGESCPLAKGFYDRLPAARQAALGEAGLNPVMDRGLVRSHALAHQVCPYHLSTELARWADVVVGDYNYWFDKRALLHGLSHVNDWRVSLLVDEAHNLVDRARGMYSAALRSHDLQAAARSAAVSGAAAIKRALGRVRRRWAEVAKQQAQPYRVLDAVPPRLLDALQRANADITAQQDQATAALDRPLLDFYFASLELCGLAAVLDANSLVDFAQHDAGRRSTLCVRNVVPAPYTGPRIARAQVCVLFSATLQPFQLYGDMLGLPPGHVAIEIESPFRASQLEVRIAGHISTRYPHRAASLLPIARLMLAQYHRLPGNYVAYFSSYAYMAQVAAAFEDLGSGVPTWMQAAGMDEAAQRAFLERFTEGGRGIAFAVLGGAFAEGVDLPGKRLVGAFVSTLGLPQVNPVNQEFRRRIDALLGSGYEYTYLYPGLRKVVQAAGRVIRTTSDEGVVVLIDDRFRQASTQALLPRWWRPAEVRLACL